MAHLLVCSNSLYGHISPLLALATALVGRGHRVQWLLHTQDDIEAARARALIARAGIELIELDGFDRHIPAPLVRAAMQRDLRAYFELGRTLGHPFYPPPAIMARQVAALNDFLRRERPALLLTEWVSAARIAATMSGTPWVSVPPGSGSWKPSDGRPLRLGDALPGMGRMGRALLNGVDRLGLYDPAANERRAAALAGQPVPERSPFLNLVGSIPAWEGIREWEAHTHFVGPLLYDFPAPPTVASQPAPERCLLVTLGTSVREPRLIQRAIEALGGEGLPLLIATGPQHDPAEFDPLPPSVHLTQWVELPSALARAEAALIVGGWSSALACLRAGVPTLIVPFIVDQVQAGERLARLGAGVMLPWAEATPARLRAAMQRLRHEPSFRACAREAAALLAAQPGVEGAADHVERLIAALGDGTFPSAGAPGHNGASPRRSAPPPPMTTTTPLTPPPTLRGWPLIGNLPTLMRGPSRTFMEGYRQLGPVFQVAVLGQAFTVMAGPEANLFLSKDGGEKLHNRPCFLPLVDSFGGDQIIVALDGADHRAGRRALKPAFTRDAIARYVPEMVESARQIIAGWPTGERLDAAALMRRLVSAQTGKAMADYIPSDEEFQTLSDFFTTALRVRVSRSLPERTLRGRAFQQNKARSLALMRRLMAAQPPTEGDAPTSMQLVQQIRRADGTLLDEADQVVTALMPFFGGLDTVASSCLFLLYELLRQPILYAKARDEARALFASGPPTVEGLRALETLHGAAMETLRLHPTAPAAQRHVAAPFDFAGHHIEAGQQVVIATTLTHFLDDYFPDPYRFDIARFRAPRNEHRRAGVYVPFGMGPHTCLGATLAEVQMILTLAVLLDQADLVLDPPSQQLRIVADPVPAAKRGIQVQLLPRR